MEGHQRGRRGSVTSVQTVDSLSTEGRLAWRAFRKELEDVGITAHYLETNHDIIIDSFVRFNATGVSEGQPVTSDDGQATPTNEASSSPRAQLPTTDDAGSHQPGIPLVTPATSEVSPAPGPLINTCTDIVKVDTPNGKPGPGEDKDSPYLPALLTTVPYHPRTRHEMFSKSRYQHHQIYELLKKKPRPSIGPLMEEALLDACMYSSHSDMVETFLNHGASPDATVHNDTPGYMFATVDPDDKLGPVDSTLHGLSALMLAASRGRNDIVGVLIDWGADVNYHLNDYCDKTKNRIGWMSTALGCAVTGGDLPTVRTILSAKALVNQAEKWKGTWWSALHEACRASSVEVCQELLDWGAQIDLCSKLGTPLMVALYFRKNDVVSLLLERGANPNWTMAGATLHGHKKPLDVAIWVANDSAKYFLDDDIFAITLLMRHGVRNNSEEVKSERNIRERRDGWKNETFDSWPSRAFNPRTASGYFPQSDPSRGIVGYPTDDQMIADLTWHYMSDEERQEFLIDFRKNNPSSDVPSTYRLR